MRQNVRHVWNKTLGKMYVELSSFPADPQRIGCAIGQQATVKIKFTLTR